MGRVDGGDLKEGLQLRLMDPSTGEPYHEWYKYTGSEIVKIIQTEGNPLELARLSLEIPAARQMTKDAVYLAAGLDAPDGLRADTELPPWVPGSRNLFVVFNGGFKGSGNRRVYVSNEGTLFCNIGVQYYTFDGSTLLLDKGSEPEMTDQTLIAARDVRDAFIGEHISRGHADKTYLERVHGRDRARDEARDAEPLPPPSRRRWVPKQSWEAYARGEREPRPTPRPRGGPREGEKKPRWTRDLGVLLCFTPSTRVAAGREVVGGLFFDLEAVRFDSTNSPFTAQARGGRRPEEPRRGARVQRRLAPDRPAPRHGPQPLCSLEALARRRRRRCRARAAKPGYQT